MSDRKEFEEWYSGNAFNYTRDPLGSRDCSLQWVAWQAGQERLRAGLAELRAAIEAMRVAGGAAEFQRAFDEAKIIAARKGEGE